MEENNNQKKKGSGADLCKLILIGNISIAPEWKHKEGQAPFCVFTMGVGESVRAGAEKKTLFCRVTLWGKNAETAMEYALKSQQVYIEGKMVVGEWRDSSDEKRYTIEVAGTEFRMTGDPLYALSKEAERLERKAISEESSTR